MNTHVARYRALFIINFRSALLKLLEHLRPLLAKTRPPVIEVVEALSQPIVMPDGNFNVEGTFVPVARPTSEACVLRFKIAGHLKDYSVAVARETAHRVSISLSLTGHANVDLTLLALVLHALEHAHGHVPPYELVFFEPTDTPAHHADEAVTGGGLRQPSLLSDELPVRRVA